MRSIKTACVHAGTFFDEKTGGVNSPVYTSTSYAYLDMDDTVYPRYFNIPNARGIGKKLAALEQAQAGMVFSSGMAAISTILFTFLKAGDHAVFQTGLYGGTYNFVSRELEPFGIEFDIAKNNTIPTLEGLIKPNTKLIYIESPSNPLLLITDIKSVAMLAKKYKVLTVIDNTFASPVNQTPVSLGIDIVMHSATKYLGGHSDICAGAVACSREHLDRIRKMALSLGGSLNAQTIYLLERSMKTLALRVEQQNRNAGQVAEWLSAQDAIRRVYYPGLNDHPGHEIAKRQMKGFGGMLSFELKSADPVQFQEKLKLIKPSVSLGGVDSIICSPALTSHRHLSVEERAREGITDGLLRLSAGIEDTDDIIRDLEQAM